MNECLIQVRHLTKNYPNGTLALKGVSFDIKRGEFLAVIGLSGSGKSTLLRCLNRSHEPTSGEIFLDGVDIAKIQKPQAIRELRRRFAMIFQNFNLIPRQSVLSNVLMGRLGSTGTFRSLMGLFSEADKAEAMKCLSIVGISDKARMRADQLSGGQQQRVAIARALAQRPELLLADEPVAALDPATSHTVMDHLLKINKEYGITVVANLHYLSLVRLYATRVIALKSGQIVFDGDPHAIDDGLFETIYGAGAQDIQVR